MPSPPRHDHDQEQQEGAEMREAEAANRAPEAASSRALQREQPTDSSEAMDVLSALSR